MSKNALEKKQSFGEFVALMALFVSITALSIDTVLPALSLIGAEQGIADINHTQYVISVLFIGFTIGQIIYGPVSDSFGRKYSIYAGLAVFVAGSFISYFSSNFTIMLVGRFFQGIGAAAPRITSITIVRDRYKGREMARVMSFVMAVFIFMPTIAPALGEVMIYFSSWRMIFLFLIFMACIAVAWTHMRLPETLKHEDKRPFTINNIWIGICAVVTNKATIGYTVCTGMMFGTLVGYISSARQIFQDYFQTGTHFVIYFAISAISVGVASITNSMIVRKFGMHRISHYALIGIMVPSFLFLPLVMLNPDHVQLWQYMLYAPVVFFCFGLLLGNLNAMAMEPMGHIAGIASAVIGFVSSAISVVVGTIIGQLYNNTLVPIVGGYLIVSVLVFLLQLYLARFRLEECVVPVAAE